MNGWAFIGGTTGSQGLWAESARCTGETTGGTLTDSGAESVGYVGGMTGGTLRDSGAESVGCIGGGRLEGHSGILGLNLSGM